MTNGHRMDTVNIKKHLNFNHSQVFKWRRRCFLNGGGGGIRTHGTRERSTVFKTAPINRSGTPPNDFSDIIYSTRAKFFVKMFFKFYFFSLRVLHEQVCAPV